MNVLYNSPVFCRVRYNEFDSMGKQVSKMFFEQQGYKFIDDGEHYGDYDFAIQKNGKTETVEVEVSACWLGCSFPFRTMTVPGRKSKSKADWFVQMNKSGTALVICPMKTVHTSEKFTKNTKYTKNEIFFSVDLKNIDHFVLQTSWENHPNTQTSTKFSLSDSLSQDNTLPLGV